MFNHFIFVDSRCKSSNCVLKISRKKIIQTKWKNSPDKIFECIREFRAKIWKNSNFNNLWNSWIKKQKLQFWILKKAKQVWRPSEWIYRLVAYLKAYLKGKENKYYWYQELSRS